MATLSSAGIGSGLDVAGLVNRLVSAERAPAQERISRQESSVKLQLSAFGQLNDVLSKLNDALSPLRDAQKLAGRSVSVEDDSVFTASAAVGAPEGQYQIEVQQLAQAHRMATATPTNPPDASIGYGTLSLQLGADSFDVVIDPGATTLADIASAINDAGDNPGVVASVINTDAGAVLQLSSTRAGADSQIQIQASGGDGGLNTLVADLADTQTQQDSVIFINGYQVTSSSNEVSGALDGVTINLKDARPGETFDLAISRDNSTAVDSVKAFVEAYNAYVGKAASLSGFDADAGSGGALNGDAMVRSLQGAMRGRLSGSFGEGSVTSLGQMGISISVDGKMSLDETALNAALDSDFNAVSSFLSGDAGFAAALGNIADRYIGSSGLIDGREDSLNQRLKQLEKTGDRLDLRMEALESRLLKQFTALDAMLAQMQQTSSYLSAQLNSLPGMS